MDWMVDLNLILNILFLTRKTRQKGYRIFERDGFGVFI